MIIFELNSIFLAKRLSKISPKNFLVFQKKCITFAERKNKKNMATAVINKPQQQTIDWVNPHLEYHITEEEYCNEMTAAENSGFISFEKHKQNMNKWLETKLQ